MQFLSRPIFVIALFLSGTGCAKPGGGPPGGGPPSGPVDVEVSAPVRGTVTDAEVFTGRTQAVMSADLRCRVSGYLEKVLFREGEDVELGAPLFQLELKPFELAVRQARGTLEQQKAQLKFNEANYTRMNDTYKQGVGSVSDLQQALSSRDASAAAVETATAALETAQQNLAWATVRAPFAGRISRRQVDPGNTVAADTTILASLVQLDPLYAYFDIDERTVLRVRSRLAPNGATKSDQALPVSLGLSDERPEEFSRSGELKFTDNKVDPNTGTLRVWGTFANPKRDLHPGLFVRVRLQVGAPRSVLMVAEAALGSDQGRRYVYAVDAENRAARVPVEIGPRANGLIAIEKGLTGEERVIVRGLQNVRPKSEVVAKAVEMPRVKSPPTGAGPSPAGPGGGPAGASGPTTGAPAPAPSEGPMSRPPAGSGGSPGGPKGGKPGR
ncbi:Efflux pump periplasmic linker BepF [Gemmata sp. SH-PL17]|uniref:efflux RND transporter periplasmic adaptor subunit n=1 Tax=Gemmata sp. SH-PL17 TaxID=1630693 RepID=UPI00078CAB3B|nr:efflux RND transporter periplasmic adaptor subunit [Gemmata sp. SH-PL17]AMV28547.1 Efflux pump periplasmic linker BepF [Gemmata sp. SH-PL17]